MTQESHTKAKRWGINLIGGLFGIALALLFVLVLRSIAVQITPPPEQLTEPYPDVSTQELCQQEGGRWITVSKSQEKPVAVSQGIQPQPYCQGPLTSERERTVQEEDSRQTSLFVFAIGGAIAVVSGLLIRTRRSVAPGLLLGGIVSFFIAGVHIWTMSAGLGRLITTIVIFIILLGAGLTIFREQE